MSGPSTGESQAPHFLLVFAQPAGVQRAVSLFIIQLGPLEESGAYGGTPSGKTSEADYRDGRMRLRSTFPKGSE